MQSARLLNWRLRINWCQLIRHFLMKSVPSLNRWWISRPIPVPLAPANRSTMTPRNCRMLRILHSMIDNTLDEMATDAAANFATRNRRAWLSCGWFFCYCHYQRHLRRRHHRLLWAVVLSVRLYFVEWRSVCLALLPELSKTWKIETRVE